MNKKKFKKPCSLLTRSVDSFMLNKQIHGEQKMENTKNINEVMQELEKKAMDKLSKYNENDYAVGMEHVYKHLRLQTKIVRDRLEEEQAQEKPCAEIISYYQGMQQMVGYFNSMLSMHQERKDSL